MNPRLLYNQIGPLRWSTVTNGIAAADFPIPENRSRSLLIVRSATSAITVRPAFNLTAPLFVVNVAGGAELIYTSVLHGILPGEAWLVNVGGGSSFAWAEASFRPGETELNKRDIVEEYRKRLLKRKRERLQRLAVESGIPECAALLLESPLQFLIRRERESAIGGGGGETGSEPLDSSTPSLIGD